MPEGIGGSGENQARRTKDSVSGQVRLSQSDRLQRCPEGLDLVAKLAELAPVSRPQRLDLPVQLLDEDVRPHEEVFHQPAGDVGATGQQLALQLLELEGSVPVVDLEGDGPEVLPQ